MSGEERRTVLPPLRVPRALLDPRRADLGPIDGNGLVAVQLRLDGDRVEAIDPWRGPTSIGRVTGWFMTVKGVSAASPRQRRIFVGSILLGGKPKKYPQR